MKYDGNSEASHTAKAVRLAPKGWRNSCRDTNRILCRNVDEFHATMRAGLTPRCGRDSRRDAGSTHPTPTTINRETKTRGHGTPKGYICLMICTTVHENSQAPICRTGGIGPSYIRATARVAPTGGWVRSKYLIICQHITRGHGAPKGSNLALPGVSEANPRIGKEPIFPGPEGGRIA